MLSVTIRTMRLANGNAILFFVCNIVFHQIKGTAVGSYSEVKYLLFYHIFIQKTLLNFLTIFNF